MPLLAIKRNKSKHETFEIVYLFFLGFIGFSRIGQHLLVNVIGLQFYLIEIFFVPFFIYNKKNLKRYLGKALHHAYAFFLILILVFDVIIGIVNTGDPINIITMTRSITYIFISFMYFREKGSFSMKKLFILSFASILGEVFYAIAIKSTSLASINTTCVAIAIIVSVYINSYWLIGISTGLAMIVSISSGYRIGIIVSLLALMEMVVWVIVCRKEESFTQTIKRIGVPMMVLAILIYLVVNFDGIVSIVAEKLNMDAFAIYRVTNRLKALIRFDFKEAQEGARFEGNRIIYTSFLDRIIPRGLVGKSTGELGTYIDIPITYFYDVFGSIGTIPMLLMCVYRGIRSFMMSFRHSKTDTQAIAGLMFPVFFLYMFINGNFLYHTFQCILTGMIVSIWFSEIKPLFGIRQRL